MEAPAPANAATPASAAAVVDGNAEVVNRINADLQRLFDSVLEDGGEKKKEEEEEVTTTTTVDEPESGSGGGGGGEVVKEDEETKKNKKKPPKKVVATKRKCGDEKAADGQKKKKKKKQIGSNSTATASAAFVDTTDKGDVMSTKDEKEEEKDQEEEESIQMLRKFSSEQINSLGSYVSLQDVARGEVLVVTHSDEVPTAFGQAALLNCVAANGVTTKVMAPHRFSSQYSARNQKEKKVYYPAILIYKGFEEYTAQGAKRKAHRVEVHSTLADYKEYSDLLDKARELRSLGAAKILSEVDIKSLKDFPVPSILSYSSLSTQNITRETVNELGASVRHSTEVMTAKYHDGKNSGRIYLPERLKSQLGAKPTGVLVYKGVGKTVSTGRDFYKVELLSNEDVRNLAKPLE